LLQDPVAVAAAEDEVGVAGYYLTIQSVGSQFSGRSTVRGDRVTTHQDRFGEVGRVVGYHAAGQDFTDAEGVFVRFGVGEDGGIEVRVGEEDVLVG